MPIFGSRNSIEYPRLVAVETTNRCNAKCSFCPNHSLARDRATMSDELFEKIIDDLKEFPLKAIEPFLNGEPLMDPKIIERMAHINRHLPDTKLRLYTNGYLLTPERIDALRELELDHLFVSVNTLNPDKYMKTMGLKLEKTLGNLDYLTDPVRKSKVARKITFRMVRMPNTPLNEQDDFLTFCKEHGVGSFIVGLFNYKGAIKSPMPVPNYPCENINRLDILADGRSALCCMDHEGDFSWGDLKTESALDVYNGTVARRYREILRTGRRRKIAPCKGCNLFWPSFEKTNPLNTTRFAAEAGYYFLRHRPSRRKRPVAPEL